MSGDLVTPGAPGVTTCLPGRDEGYATGQGNASAGLGVGLPPRLGLRNQHPGVVVRPVRNPERVRVISAAGREIVLELN